MGPLGLNPYSWTGFCEGVGGMSPRSVDAEVLSAGVPSSCDRADASRWLSDAISRFLRATIYRWRAQEEVNLGEHPGLRSGEHIGHRRSVSFATSSSVA